MPLKSCFAVLLAAIFLLATGLNLLAEPANNQLFLLRAQKDLQTAQTAYATNSHSMEAAWQVGRAAFNVAELATNDTQRAEIARIGITACRAALARESNSAPAHYYLGVNLGELAQSEAPSLTAYRLVHEVEREFKTAAELDVRFDHAGPARTLGTLYFQAPGWPLSVGSKPKAREWLERAASLAPDFPENQLNLFEAQIKWRLREEAAKTLKTIEVLWPMAQTNFTGEAWELSWQQWNTRHAALKADYRRIYGQHP